MAKYIWPNMGRHDVGWGLGRHLGGGVETFLVPEDVVKHNPHKFTPVQQLVADPNSPPKVMIQPASIAPPEPISVAPQTTNKTLDFSSLNPFVQQQLTDAALTTKEAIRQIGLSGLQNLKGIGPATAKRIMELVE